MKEPCRSSGRTFVSHRGVGLSVVVHLDALELAQKVELHLQPVGEADLVARAFLLDLHDRDVGIVLRHIVADCLGYQLVGHGALSAVDRFPLALVGELDGRAVGEAHVVVGFLEQMAVDFDKAHLGFREILVEHGLSFFGQVVAADDIAVDEGEGRRRGQ